MDGSVLLVLSSWNLKPDNQQVVYTLEDVKVSMSAYLYAMCSPVQYPLYYNDVLVGFPYSKRPCANFVMYSDDILMTKAVDNAYSRIYDENYLEMWTGGKNFAESFWSCAYLNIGYLNTVLHDLENVGNEYKIWRIMNGLVGKLGYFVLTIFLSYCNCLLHMEIMN